jgi:ABC-2 type transport system permease protein
MRAILWTEILKVRKSKIFPISIYFFAFIGIMMGLLMYLSMHPEIASRSSTMDMKTDFLGGADWTAFYDLLLQIVLTVGVIGSGIITAWCFGREFSEKVLKDLLALPVSRSNIVISKLLILFVWSILLLITSLLTALLIAAIIKLPGWRPHEFNLFLENYLICAILNTLLITVVAFVASAGRGYMLPISFVILILILTQILFVGLPGLSFWFPWALPALYSGVAGTAAPEPGAISYILYGLVVIGGIIGTNGWWLYADHK